MKGIVFGLIASLGILPGCSTIMAMSEPDPVHYRRILPGEYRSEVIETLGEPTASYKTTKGNTFDEFEFVNGKEDTNKMVRAVGYAVLDLLTLFISELFTVPLEMYYGGNLERLVEIRASKAFKYALGVTVAEASLLSVDVADQVVQFVIVDVLWRQGAERDALLVGCLAERQRRQEHV